MTKGGFKLDILARNDGIQMKPLPEIPDESLKKNDEIPDELSTKENEVHDGFDTHFICRWCGKGIKDVYVPKFKDGHNGKPVSTILNYTPCDDCRKKWNELVVCIEVTAKEPYTDCLPITYADTKKDEKGNSSKIPVYPTGRYVGLYPDYVENTFGKFGKDIKKGDITYFDCEMFNTAFGQVFPAETNNTEA